MTHSSPPAPGFLGSTSYSAVFTEGQSHIGLNNLQGSAYVDSIGAEPPKLSRQDPTRIKEGVHLLTLLADLPKYESSINHWYQHAYGLCPLFIRECVASVRSDLGGRSNRESSLLLLSERIFAKTSTPFFIDGTTTLRQFCPLLTGANLRWETVGVIPSIMGLSTIALGEVNVFMSGEQLMDYKDLARQMLHAGNACMVFCDEMGHLNNVVVWLISVNFILHTHLYGDAGRAAVPRVNLAVADVTKITFHGADWEISRQPSSPLALTRSERALPRLPFGWLSCIGELFGLPTYGTRTLRHFLGGLP